MENISQSIDRDDVIHLQDYLNILLYRRKAFFIAFSIIFFSVAAYTFLMKPVYEATATLRLREEKGKLSAIEELTIGSTSPVNAEIEILKSRTNAEKVVKRLHLNLAVEKKKGNPSFKILELSTDKKQGSFTILQMENDTYTVSDEAGVVIGQGKSGILMQGKDITLLLDNFRGSPGDRIDIDLVPFNAVVQNLRDNTIAEESPKQTNIIKLSYKDTNPFLARDVANNLVQAYLEQTIAFKAEEASRTVEFIEQQLENVKKDLDISERNLEAFKRSTGVVHLDVEAQELIKKYSETEKERAGVVLQKKQAEFALTSLKEAMARRETYSPAVLKDDPLISGMAAKLADLEVQKQSLLADYTPAHPSVKSVQEQIDELQLKIQTTYETALHTYEKQEGAISRHITGYENDLKRLPATERELARLTRLYKVNADIYTFLLQKHEEARIAKASTISNIDIVDAAILPEEPVKPQIPLYLFIGFLAATLAGILAALTREYLDNTIKDAEQAKRELQLPLLAVIPYIMVKEETAEKEKQVSLIAHYEPKSSISEAFRSLRTGIHFSGVSKKRQVIMVTSSLPYEGKTTIMGNFAVVLSQTGARVLLVDCDLRRSALHRLFGHKKSPGLTELLAGDNNIENFIHNTGIPGLDFMSAGTTPPNPAELLGSDKMNVLLQKFKDRYDAILIDAPPVLAVTDALILSSMTDMVFMILELGRIPIKAVTHARDMLQNINAPLAGVVLNDKVEHRLERYGYYGEKYYRYRYYGYSHYGYSYYGEEPRKQKERRTWWQWFMKK